MIQRKGLKLIQIIPRLVRVSDLLAMTALFGSQEVSILMLIPLGAMAVTSYLSGFFRKDTQQKWVNRILFGCLTSVVIIAMTMVIRTHLYPLIIATYTTMIVHGLMWFLPPNNRTRSVRMLVGLVEVAVAAVLTPEMYIALVIFCFVVVVSVEMSLIFLQDQLLRFDSEKVKQPLPPGFLFHSLSVSVVVFFLSLLIFPILPRAHTSLGSTWAQDKTRIGYTEQVNLGVLPSWTGSAAERAIALRIYLPSESVVAGTWKLRFPMSLVRSRVLDRFEGTRWIPDTHNGLELESEPTREVMDSDKSDPIRLEVIREPIESNFLPTPYGVQTVELGIGLHPNMLHRSVTGTWFIPGTEHRRLQYFVTGVFGERLQDKPAKIHLEVPQDWIGSSPRWLELKERIFKGAVTPREKLERIERFFRTSGYSVANENPMGDAKNTTKVALQDPRKQVDVFLFVLKRGHCEYFASSAALLLRMAGVPTRLVAGFRLSSGPIGDVITIRQGDGHAWIEAWLPERGWVALDPTPKMLKPGAKFGDALALAQDFLSAYWYRYVLSFDQSEQVERGVGHAKTIWKELSPSAVMGSSWNGHQAVDWLLPIAILAIVAVFFVILRFGVNFSLGAGWVVRSFRDRIPWSLSWRLYRAGLWFRATLKHELVAPDKMSLRSPAYRSWYALADRLHYGPVRSGTPEWQTALAEMDRLWPTVQDEISQPRAA